MRDKVLVVNFDMEEEEINSVANRLHWKKVNDQLPDAMMVDVGYNK